MCNTIHTKDIPNIEKSALKEVKKEDSQEDVQKVQENIGSAFSLSLGARKNSAFNNIRNERSQALL